MIYYLVRIHPNGDEDVIQSWDNVVPAILALEGCRRVGATDIQYRLDTVQTDKPKPQIPEPINLVDWQKYKKAQQRKNKLLMNALYGKHRTKDFTTNELFGNPESMDHLECSECGAHVLNHRKHVAWHNKLLP